MQFQRIAPWIRRSLALWPLWLACYGADAASSENATEPAATCILKAAAQLSFNGNIYVSIGKDKLTRSFGNSDANGRIPISGTTRFNIASAGKMFTAVGIGRLVDQGLVQFDSPISRYLDDLEPDMGTITIAELLNHTAGLGNYFDPRNSAAIENARTAMDLLSSALAEPLAFPPGSKRAYSNSGFVVLGAIIEKVSGFAYADFIYKEILQPLGMRDTVFDASVAAVAMSRMAPDGTHKEPLAVPRVFLRSSPAGGIYSTVEDLATFLTALNGGHLLRAKTLAELLTPRPDPSARDKLYAYGFNVRPEHPYRVGHGGGAPGMNAEIALYPESGRQIIALSNRDPPTATQMVTILEKVIFAQDPMAACETALADPALHAPMPVRSQRR
jgi:D-alanyl-D-alanine carboxypeptidase